MKWLACDIRELTNEEFENAYRLLTPEEKCRVDGLHDGQARQQTLAAQHLARKLIAQLWQLREEGITFAHTEMGKLYPVGLAAEISVSHSENLVVCAADQRPVGIDVERLRPVKLQSAKKICSAHELSYLFGKAPRQEDFAYTEDPALIRRFFRLWTGKEACAKRQGQGIGSLHRVFPLEDTVQYHVYEDYLICIATTNM